MKVLQKTTPSSAQGTKRFQGILKKSALSFLSMAPLLLGIIGLIGLFQASVDPKSLTSFFSGSIFIDTFIGTGAGAFASGNPVMSYLIGGELLEQGISFYAVTAFILSWVTLGFFHLPAEAEVFGTRFTLYRNILAFIFIIIIAMLTGLTMTYTT